MALLSDIDWVILALVGAYLVLGPGNRDLLRTLGRWYGRAARLKQDLLHEVTAAAGLPANRPSSALSVRGLLLGPDVRVAPSAPLGVGRPTALPSSPVLEPWTGGSPVPVWATTPRFDAGGLEATR